MNSKPLSYDSLKTVLQLMDANTRINLSARVPSIRKTEKAVPLRIKSLYFESNLIIIDNMYYQVGVVRDYGALKTPFYVKKCNEEGGSCYDIDEYGFEDSSTMKQKMHPEDIVMKPQVIEEPPPRNDDTIRQKEAEIIDLKNQVLELENQYQKLLNDHGFESIDELDYHLYFAQKQNDEDLYKALYRVFSDSRSTNCTIMWKLNDIDEIRHYIQCYHDFRNKIPPPYKSYLQLTVSHERDGNEGCIDEQIERVEYNKLLPFALRAVSDFIFKGRRHPVHVELYQQIGQEDIIRVPCDLRLKFRKMEIYGDLGLASNALQSIIHCTSLPLEQLEVGNYFNDPLIDNNDFQCDIAKKAEKLVISRSDNVAWLPILLALQNKNVEMRHSSSLTVDDYVAFVRSWTVQGKSIGTVFTFSLGVIIVGQEIIDRIAEEHRGAVKKDRCVTVPVPNNSSQILVSIWKNEEALFNIGTRFYYEGFLGVKVVLSGNGLN